MHTHPPSKHISTSRIITIHTLQRVLRGCILSCRTKRINARPQCTAEFTFGGASDMGCTDSRQQQKIQSNICNSKENGTESNRDDNKDNYNCNEENRVSGDMTTTTTNTSISFEFSDDDRWSGPSASLYSHSDPAVRWRQQDQIQHQGEEHHQLNKQHQHTGHNDYNVQEAKFGSPLPITSSSLYGNQISDEKSVPFAAAGDGVSATSMFGALDPAEASPVFFHDNMSLAELTDVAPLAHGGFCVVCSCTYRGRRAALKVPRPGGGVGASSDLMVEIDVYRRISQRGGHPSLARAFGAGTHVQQGVEAPFLVLELLDGGTLAKALERSRLHPGDSLNCNPVCRLPVGLELADALVFLHNEAIPGGFILHRDLKPANIGLCAQGHVKVFDLGLSVTREIRDTRNDKYQMSGMAGSKRFMAPEVCMGLPYNDKVDVYSFAIVLWEICTLVKPFAGMSVADHYQSVILGGLRPPLSPSWPASLCTILQACWNADPDRRPSIWEARVALREVYLEGSGITVVP